MPHGQLQTKKAVRHKVERPGRIGRQIALATSSDPQPAATALQQQSHGKSGRLDPVKIHNK